MLRPFLTLSLAVLLLGGCATAPSPIPAVGAPKVVWPVASVATVDRCRNEAASQCLGEAQQALAATPPDQLRAQQLLAAACDAQLQKACALLDERFRPPTVIRVPTLWSSVQFARGAVMEFSCRLTTSGELKGCLLNRSLNSNANLDQQATERLRKAEAGARLTPASVDGAPFETELQLVYLIQAPSTPGSAATPLPIDDRPNSNVLLMKNRSETQ